MSSPEGRERKRQSESFCFLLEVSAFNPHRELPRFRKIFPTTATQDDGDFTPRLVNLWSPVLN